MSLNNDGHGVDAAVAAVLFKPVNIARRAENGLGLVSTAQFGSTGTDVRQAVPLVPLKPDGPIRWFQQQHAVFSGLDP